MAVGAKAAPDLGITDVASSWVDRAVQRWPSPWQWLAAAGVALAIVVLGRATPAQAVDSSPGPRTAPAATSAVPPSPARQSVPPAVPSATTQPVSGRTNTVPIGHAGSGSVNVPPPAPKLGAAASPQLPPPSPPVATPQPAGPP